MRTKDKRERELFSSLTKLREPKDETPKGQRRMVLSELDYSKDFLIEQFDAALIDIVKEQFGITRDMDLLLMAFGLLEGYYYGDISSITARRDKYLREINFINKEQIAYKDMNEEDRQSCLENLRKGREETCISQLAKALLNHIKIESFMTLHENCSSVKLQRPYYLQNTQSSSMEFKITKQSILKIRKTNKTIQSVTIEDVDIEDVYIEKGKLKKLRIAFTAIVSFSMMFVAIVCFAYLPDSNKPTVDDMNPECSSNKTSSSIYINENPSGCLEEPTKSISLNGELDYNELKSSGGTS